MKAIDDEHHREFLRLYAEYEPALHTFVRSMLPSRNEAAEVLQNVIVVLWQKYGTANDFKKWAFGVARLEVLKFLQAKKRDRLIFDEDLVNQLADQAITREPRHLSHREALQLCIQKLPSVHRQILYAAYERGSQISRLASERGVSPMSLYKLLQRIRQQLLECVTRIVAAEEHS